MAHMPYFLPDLVLDGSRPFLEHFQNASRSHPGSLEKATWFSLSRHTTRGSKRQIHSRCASELKRSPLQGNDLDGACLVAVLTTHPNRRTTTRPRAARRHDSGLSSDSLLQRFFWNLSICWMCSLIFKNICFRSVPAGQVASGQFSGSSQT
jgi:hypothetical protein